MKTNQPSSNEIRYPTEIKFLKSTDSADGFDLYEITETHTTTVRNLKEVSLNIYKCRYDQQFILEWMTHQQPSTI